MRRGKSVWPGGALPVAAKALQPSAGLNDTSIPVDGSVARVAAQVWISGIGVQHSTLLRLLDGKLSLHSFDRRIARRIVVLSRAREIRVA